MRYGLALLALLAIPSTIQARQGLLPKAVIPAQAGIHDAQDAHEPRWMPAPPFAGGRLCAGMTFIEPFR